MTQGQVEYLTLELSSRDHKQNKKSIKILSMSVHSVQVRPIKFGIKWFDKKEFTFISVPI